MHMFLMGLKSTPCREEPECLRFDLLKEGMVQVGILDNSR